MKSALRLAAKAASPARPPVPIGDSGIWRMQGSLRGSADEAFLRAYSSQGTVFSNAALLASAAAGQDWKLFRAQQPGSRYTTSDEGSDQRQEVTQHPALALLNSPNPFWSRFRLMELSQLYQELTGKWHWVVTKAAGVPIGLWPVRPDRMQPVPDPDTYLRGWVYTAPGGTERIPLGVDEVIYEYLPNPIDSYDGTGWVQPVLTEIEGARYASEYNRNYFSNSARPDGVIQVDHRMDDDEWEEFQLRWMESHRGVARAHRVAMLENGATWIPAGTNAKDMDFVNLLSSAGDRIRESSGMHKIMTGLTEDVNRANAQTGEEIFASWKVDPRLKRRRDTLNFQYLKLFGKTGEAVQLDYKYPMPVNREADNLELANKCNSAAALVGAGYDPADVLVAVGLPAMGIAVKPPPSGLPAGTPGAGMPAPAAIPGEAGQGGDAENALRALRASAGWDSLSWEALDRLRRNAALNMAGSRR